MPQPDSFRLINRFILQHRLLIFLCSLLTLLIFFPIIYEQYGDYLYILELLFSIILITGIYIVSANRKILTVAILLASLTLSIFWFNIILQSSSLLTFGLMLEIIFFAITTTTILIHVLQYKKVTADKIYGAICGYLLIGIIWALMYTTVENMYPGSFLFINGVTGPHHFQSLHRFYFSYFLYYSFVTLTTLGYGDILPLTAVTRILSSIQAVIGQLYVAVLIARLVGLHISHTTIAAWRKD